jgi:hypothetical protein
MNSGAKQCEQLADAIVRGAGSRRSLVFAPGLRQVHRHLLTMLCIFCARERPPSLEHVFPLAIGGTITFNRVCQECNSTLGTRVDAALSDFLPVRIRRAKLGLAGNTGTVPAMYEVFLGVAKVVGSDGVRVKTTFNKATGKPETRQLYHAAEVVTPDGRKTRQISIDARDRHQIPLIIQRERKRHGLPPLSEGDLAAAAKDYTATTIEHPMLQNDIGFNFAYLRHAMMKIAYELAFLWLGDAYLDDPLATELRAAILDPDIASTDHIPAYVGDAKGCGVFQFWTPHEAHHIAFANIVAGDVVISVRVFDLYAAAIVVSNDHRRYFPDREAAGKLRFVAIDAATGKTINTTFAEETRRIGAVMATYRRPPPFPDPLPA